MAANSIEGAAKSLQDCSRILVFDVHGTVLYSTFQVNPAELTSLTHTLDDRDSAIRAGMTLQDTRYEVHRYHPPLVYGRSMDSNPEASEGCAMYAARKGPTGSPTFAVITYRMPNVSARMVSQLVTWCERNLEQ